MRLALVSDAFPPLRSSAAVQLRDLSAEMVRQGHSLTVIVAAPALERAWEISEWQGAQVLRLKAPRTKDVGYATRTLGELLMPYRMLRGLQASPVGKERWDGVIWYSPTIFLGPLVRAIKRSSFCKSYLIIRDIFPEWAVDLGLMGRGLPYRFFKTVANFQYSVADTIGVQSPGNLAYFSAWGGQEGRKLEVLYNWLAESKDRGCSISIANTRLAGRRVLVYAGNMGVAQGVGSLLELADYMRGFSEIGFLFVGRGSEVEALRADAIRRELENVVFCDEIDPDEIAGLYAQCHIGLLTLDPKHRTHNIPGKFLSYLRGGLPVMGMVNAGNDIIDLVRSERVGRAITTDSMEVLSRCVWQLLDDIERDSEYSSRCRKLAERLFSPAAAARQIALALQVR